MGKIDNSEQASAYVLSRVLEQAAQDGTIFDSFELRLLDGSAAEGEVEDYETRNDGADADELWAKVDRIARLTVKKDPDLRQAMIAAERVPSYLNDVLVVGGIAHARTTREQVRHLALLAIVCIAGGLAVGLAGIFLVPYFDNTTEHATKPLAPLLDKYGLPLFVALLVTAIFWSVRRLRQSS
ncbi:MAG TPA: hypothetical protein VGL89_01310 [Candidatus Koribacter sp.]|jgi:hypothetical protein